MRCPCVLGRPVLPVVCCQHRDRLCKSLELLYLPLLRGCLRSIS